MNSTYCPCSYSFILKFLIFVIFFFCRLMTNCKNAIYLKEWVQIVSLVYELWIIELSKSKISWKYHQFLHCFHPGWIFDKKKTIFTHCCCHSHFSAAICKIVPAFFEHKCKFFQPQWVFHKIIKSFLKGFFYAIKTKPQYNIF